MHGVVNNGPDRTKAIEGKKNLDELTNMTPNSTTPLQIFFKWKTLGTCSLWLDSVS